MMSLYLFDIEILTIGFKAVDLLYASSMRILQNFLGLHLLPFKMYSHNILSDLYCFMITSEADINIICSIRKCLSKG